MARKMIMIKYFKVLLFIIVLLALSVTSRLYCSDLKNNQSSVFSEEEKVWISSHPVISVAIDPDFPPIEFYDERGVPRGISCGFIQLLEMKTGLQFKFIRVANWTAALDGVTKKEIDLVCAATPSPARKKRMLFTDPVVKIPVVIVSRAGGNDNMTLDDLKGKSVAIVDGYIMEDYVKENYPEIKVYAVPNARAGLRMVSSGEAFAMLEYLSSVSYYIGKEGISNLKIVGDTHKFARLAMATRNDWPILRQILEKGLKQITDSERKAVIGKWVSLTSPPFYAKKKFWLISGGAIGSLLLLILLMLGWNWSLRAVVKQRTQSLKKELDERLRVEQALRNREEQFKTIFETAQDAIFILDWDSMVDCNSMTYKMFGVTKEEMVGYNPVEFSPDLQPDGTPSLERAAKLRDAAFKGEPQFFEWVHRRPDGTCFDSEIKLNLIKFKDDVQLLAIVRDITARKQAQKEKEKLQAQLIQSQKLESVGRLAGGIAHDFNNMLCVIIGYTERIMRSIDSSWQMYSELDEIRKAASRSAALTRQLLAFARKETVEPEVLELNEVVEGTLKMLGHLIGEDIELSWQPNAKSDTIFMDPAQIDQILVNLCVNARDAIANMGRISIETANVVIDENYCIEHKDFTTGEFVMLTVSDNGCGMDSETSAHVFEPFFTTKKTGEGTGMGLATIHGIVKQNNGFINVYSEPGQGTTFKIYIPRYIKHPEYMGGQQPVQSDIGGHETILLVEDEIMLLELSTEILESLGYRVLAVDVPSKAIRLAEKYSADIDLLITDVIMPEMNGRDLAERLTGIIPQLKIIYMSGYTANVVVQRGILDQEFNFIQKPYNSNDLSKKIRAVLDGVPTQAEETA